MKNRETHSASKSTLKRRKHPWANYKWLKIGALVMTAALVFIGVTSLSGKLASQRKVGQSFKQVPTMLQASYDLFDVGVADVNNDNQLDVFTLNHSAQQDLLLASESGQYQNVLSTWALNQDNDFPQIEDTDRAPQFQGAGLFIYRQNFDLVLETHRLAQVSTKVTGQLTLDLPVTIAEETKATVTNQTVAGQTVVEFTLEDGGRSVIKEFPEIPHRFEIKDFPLQNIFVGENFQQPSSSQFELLWRDRHSMAWADLNSDGQKDVFIGRGGIRGKLKDLSIPLNDELFYSQGSSKAPPTNGQPVFDNRIEKSGLIKAGCPARQSAWVDFNQDDLLDLYIVCGRVKDDAPYPNQLYQQQRQGKFVEVTAKAGLDFPQAGYFSWIDIDNDQDLDLIATQEQQLQVYQNTAAVFAPLGESIALGETITQLAISDVDADGDYDLYAVSSAGNALLENDSGRLTRVDPATRGLPTSGLSAAWVDYDNDGRVDLHVMPQGLYQQSKNGQFISTDLLKPKFPGFNTWNGKAVWFDANNDGTRDVLMAYQQTPSVLQPTPSLSRRLRDQLLKQDTSKLWQSQFYHNQTNQNHWLEIKLIGNDSNHEAIGAQVVLKQGKTIARQQIGIHENSNYSQGHYRLYYGLGSNRNIDTLEITWPNGERQIVTSPQSDQLLTIQQKKER